VEGSFFSLSDISVAGVDERVVVVSMGGSMGGEE
jgi:hypothetical protein